MKNKVIKLFTDGEVTTKDERKFTRLVGGFGDDKPILTTKQISELIGYDNSIVTRTINRNIKHFTENVDIIDLKSAMPEWQSEIGYTKNAYNASKNIYVLSEAGFLLYLKFADGDIAVDLYKDFLEDYFKIKAENIVMKKTLLEELEELKKDKAMYLGMSIVEQDEIKKLEWLNKNENVSNRIKEIELSLKEEEIIKKLKPKIDVADALTNTNGYYDIGTFSKIIKVKDLGRNNLFKWMRDKEILMYNNQPYQRYIDYFKVLPIENKYTHRTDYKTMIKANGIKYIINKLIKDGKVITKTVDEILTVLEPEKIA
ncbi:phage antirepressor KilAC domain-containing protein [Clostridium sp.]|uniref:phage antirepressor KilAC domain-containing protein n=1 Tax=Clostridium sp. TaxID=1506 RepID=UPI0026282DCE|nr:phage antirepressor KilAC domain-containing protein [Clostridium sp.]